MDFFVERESAATVRSQMATLGYRVAGVNFVENSVQDLSKEEALMYRLYADHLPSFAIETNEELCPAIKVDFSFELAWSGAKLDDVERVLSGALSGHLSSQDRLLHTIDCGLHFYREAVFGNNVKWFPYYGLSMQKCMDFAILAEAFEAPDIPPTIAPHLRWVAAHVDGVLSSKSEIALFGNQSQPSHNGWLDSSGNIREWPLPMSERLLSVIEWDESFFN